MKNLESGEDFSKALMTQEPLLNTTDFKRQRARIMARFARAKRREGLARWITFAVAGLGSTGFILLGAVNLEKIGRSDIWPEWINTLAAATFLLLPLTVSIVTALYFFRHRRALQKVQLESDQHMLSELNMQIEVLKRRLPIDKPTGEPAVGQAGDTAKQSCTDAFTLIELLMVIGILGMLAGLILPSLAQAKARAKTTFCQNNLGQLGRALAMYVGEFHKYPATSANPFIPSNTVDPHLRDKDAVSANDVPWDFRLLPYLSFDYSSMRCPAHVTSKREAMIRDYRANYNYGYNAFGSGANGPAQNLGLGRFWLTNDKLETSLTIPPYFVSEASVISPADMIAIADRKGGDELTTALVIPGQPGKSSDNDPSDCHRNGANAVFCDIHVEYARQSRWKERSEFARRRWNNDRQPHSETW